MYRYLLLAFFLVPLLEVWIFVKVGRETGAPLVIALIFLTAVIGLYFLRQQGFATLQRAQNALENGTVPAIELIEGAMLLIAGAFLMTPGFFTDFIGFLLLWGSARHLLAGKLFVRLAEQSNFRAQAQTEYHRQQRTVEPGERGEPGSHETIEGEFTREKDS